MSITWVELLSCCIVALLSQTIGQGGAGNWCSCEDRNVTNIIKTCEPEFVARILVIKATSFDEGGKTVYKIKLKRLFRLPNKERTDLIDNYLITTCGDKLEENTQYLVSGRTGEYESFLPTFLKKSGKEFLAACKHEFIVVEWNSVSVEEKKFLNNPDCTDDGGSPGLTTAVPDSSGSSDGGNSGDSDNRRN